MTPLRKFGAAFKRVVAGFVPAAATPPAVETTPGDAPDGLPAAPAAGSDSEPPAPDASSVSGENADWFHAMLMVWLPWISTVWMSATIEFVTLRPR